jgi:hypothetical protein
MATSATPNPNAVNPKRISMRGGGDRFSQPNIGKDKVAWSTNEVLRPASFYARTACDILPLASSRPLRYAEAMGRDFRREHARSFGLAIGGDDDLIFDRKKPRRLPYCVCAILLSPGELQTQSQPGNRNLSSTWMRREPA